MFHKILIANRGEIACRIITTCQRLGIRTVAVYSEADERAKHVQLADEAYYIGAAPSQDSYLCGDKIIAVAQQAKAEAIHPGYGFLSENADFATACEQQSIIFIGPSPKAIRLMGSKSEAKTIMEKAQVPLVPGYHGEDQSAATLLKQAKKIGFPVLLKAAAGGGGKGMRIVPDEASFKAALASAKRESKASFADDTMLIEKYLRDPRHIEIQVFADHQDKVLYLFERDCSIQRRHQKIIEEAPAPNFSQQLRQQMGEAAVKAAAAIDYRGAGTIEFLLDQSGEFYFMEMNTRLQVEHPVTEMITGLDLVEWQLLVAQQQPLPLNQEDLQIQGHAIEVRIYAEDPSKEFLPSTGKIHYLQRPVESEHVRLDSGIQQDAVITPYYDPMLAKLIVWDKDRLSANKRLLQALWNYHIVGVQTNITYLATILRHPAFQQGQLTTQFIEHHGEELQQQQQHSQQQALALACLAVLLQETQHNEQQSSQSQDPFSPWQMSDGWRLNLPYQRKLQFIYQHQSHSVTVNFEAPHYTLWIEDEPLQVKGELISNHQLRAVIAGKRVKATFIQQGNELTLLGYGFHHCLSLKDVSMASHDTSSDSGHLTSPMPGTVVAVNVTPKENVKQGMSLIVVEAMKMEHSINAPSDGLIKAIHYNVGDTVEEGVDLVDFEPVAV